MSNIDLNELFDAQAKLDEEIANKHNITYFTTRNKRILSLFVELGELANSTRCFKYWSNKPSETIERVLDEYVDGLHFFLSLGIDIKTDKKVYHYTKHKNNLTDQILLTYQALNIFNKKQNEMSFIRAFQCFINIIPLLNVNWPKVKKAYYKKLDENYVRQANNY